MTATDQKRKLQAYALYERYGRPLELAHQGQYVAIAPTGESVVAPTVLEVVEKASEAFGPGSFVFKLGEKTVWRWR